MARGQSHKCRITQPLIGLSAIHHSCFNRIELHIATACQQVGIHINWTDLVTPLPQRATTLLKGIHKTDLPTRKRFHQLRDGSHVVVRLNDQMHMVRHQAVTEHLQFIDLFPFLKIRQVVFKITTFDKHGLSVMTTLENMVGKTGHNHPGLSWLKHRILSALSADINRSTLEVGSDLL